MMITMTDQQATDEAVLLVMRKLGRLYPEVHADILSKLPEGARDALMMADNRADKLRASYLITPDIQHAWPTPFEPEDDGDGDDDDVLATEFPAVAKGLAAGTVTKN